MTKSRNKKKNRDDADSMDVSQPKSVSEAPTEAMDTTETGDPKPAPRARILTRKGKPMKRIKNKRKMKAVAKALDLNDKIAERASKNKVKTQRTLDAKKLYD
ncbi:unnamed protein product [Microthlaspi erraticum]|uniref:Uncharacterized protein n=1 Tax=Microthlaspi erraticum TaxID=1685480 RepID=A0A6D2IF33_9BRAS|nr:unnamed protein product [Microthlaspi erraticum]